MVTCGMSVDVVTCRTNVAMVTCGMSVVVICLWMNATMVTCGIGVTIITCGMSVAGLLCWAMADPGGLTFPGLLTPGKLDGCICLGTWK